MIALVASTHRRNSLPSHSPVGRTHTRQSRPPSPADELTERSAHTTHTGQTRSGEAWSGGDGSTSSALNRRGAIVRDVRACACAVVRVCACVHVCVCVCVRVRVCVCVSGHAGVNTGSTTILSHSQSRTHARTQTSSLGQWQHRPGRGAPLPADLGLLERSRLQVGMRACRPCEHVVHHDDMQALLGPGHGRACMLKRKITHT